MGKIYSVCIGREKLISLKSGKSIKISHTNSPRWNRLYNKRIKKVRFYHQQFSDEGIFKVVNHEKLNRLHETIIVLTVIYENS